MPRMETSMALVASTVSAPPTFTLRRLIVAVVARVWVSVEPVRVRLFAASAPLTSIVAVVSVMSPDASTLVKRKRLVLLPLNVVAVAPLLSMMPAPRAVILSARTKPR